MIGCSVKKMRRVKSLTRKARLYSARFFKFLTKRKFTNANQVLKNIKGEIRTTEWHNGYINALEGMILALRSRHQQVFIKIVIPKDIGKLAKKFYAQSRNQLHADFDRGYFTAWTEYIRILDDIKEK